MHASIIYRLHILHIHILHIIYIYTYYYAQMSHMHTIINLYKIAHYEFNRCPGIAAVIKENNINSLNSVFIMQTNLFLNHCLYFLNHIIYVLLPIECNISG